MQTADTSAAHNRKSKHFFFSRYGDSGAALSRAGRCAVSQRPLPCGQPIVGMAKLAPLRIPDGQREVVVLSRV